MEKFTPPKMVNWYDPRQLYATALKAVVSGTFASYADNREVQAALDKSRSSFTLRRQKPKMKVSDEIEFLETEAEYHTREMWIDYISDTGDGFGPTYTIADLAAQTLHVKEDPNFSGMSENNTGQLLAGDLLILGGDQVYPTPTKEEYDNRFKIPFRAASKKYYDGAVRKMFAIPGNHDWYDGLGNFIKLFCQKRHIGNWHTEQRRSYFAIQLSHSYWLWGVDVQLNSDIDQPQKDYFSEIARKDMKNGDKVILCTSEPAWVYNKTRRNDETYRRLKFFEQVFITDDNYNCKDGHKFELVATLTGDLHHYSRYEEYKQIEDENGQVTKEYLNHLITAGGGGAFLHPTHNLPEELVELNKVDDPVLRNTQVRDPKLQACFPDKKKSRSMANGTLLFPFYNWAFWLTMTFIQLGLAWMLVSTSSQTWDSQDFMHQLAHALNFEEVLVVIARNLYLNAPVLLICFVVVGGMTFFTDTYSGKGYRIFGFIHGLWQLSSMFFFIWLWSFVNINKFQITHDLLYSGLYIVEVFLSGGLLGSFFMGFYLWFCNCFLKIHDNESFSALARPHYKNFLRLHITKTGDLEIYPIGVEKVITNWTVSGEGENIRFDSAEPISYKLIEKPIIIPKNNQL